MGYGHERVCRWGKRLPEGQGRLNLRLRLTVRRVEQGCRGLVCLWLGGGGGDEAGYRGAKGCQVRTCGYVTGEPGVRRFAKTGQVGILRVCLCS